MENDFIIRIEEIYNPIERHYEFSGDRMRQYTKLMVDISSKTIEEIDKTIKICKESNVFLTMKSHELGLIFP
jgi:RNase P subunit RPR2